MRFQSIGVQIPTPFQPSIGQRRSQSALKWKIWSCSSSNRHVSVHRIEGSLKDTSISRQHKTSGRKITRANFRKCLRSRGNQKFMISRLLRVGRTRLTAIRIPKTLATHSSSSNNKRLKEEIRSKERSKNWKKIRKILMLIKAD